MWTASELVASQPVPCRYSLIKWKSKAALRKRDGYEQREDRAFLQVVKKVPVSEPLVGPGKQAPSEAAESSLCVQLPKELSSIGFRFFLTHLLDAP